MRPPSGATSSSACMPPPLPVVRISSRKPNAFVRNSIAAAPSSYRRYGVTRCSMKRRLGRLRHRVLEKCFRRPAGDTAELGDQVRLVREAALEGELSPGHRPGELACPLETEEPRDRLGRQPDLVAEAADDPLAAPAELGRERADRDATVCFAKSPPCPRHFPRRLCVGEPARERVVEQPEAVVPVGCEGKTLDEKRVEHLLDRRAPSREFV